MDFSKLSTIKKKNSVISSIRTETKTKEVQEKPIIERKLTGKNTEELSQYKKVYQGCDKCGTERVHYIKNDFVTCMYCINSYLLQSGRKPLSNNMLSIPTIQKFIWL